MDISDLHKTVQHKKATADSDKIREKFGASSKKIVQLKVAQDTAFWEKSEALSSLSRDHERLQQNMLQLQMENEAMSSRLQDELRRRPETLNRLTSTREICDTLEEHTGHLRASLQRVQADRDAIEAAYGQARRLVDDAVRRLADDTEMRVQLKQSQEQITVLTGNLVAARAQYEAVATEARAQVAVSAAEADRVRRDARDCLDAETARARAEIAERENTISELREKLSSAAVAVTERTEWARSEIARLEQEVTAAEGQAAAATREAERRNADLDAERDAHQRERREKLETIDELRRNFQSLYAVKEELQKQNDKIKEQHTHLLEEYEIKLQLEREARAEAERREQAAAENAATIALAAKKAEAEREDACKQAEQANAKRKEIECTLKMSANQTAQQLDEARKATDIAVFERDEARAAAEQTKTERDKARKSAKQFAKEIDEARAIAEKTAQELNEARKAASEAVKERNEEKKTAIQALQERDQALNAAKQANDERNYAHKAAKQAIQDKNIATEAAQKAAIERDEAKKTAEEAIKERDEAKKAAAEAVTERDRVREEAKQAIEERDKARAEVKLVTEERDEARAALSKSEQERSDCSSTIARMMEDLSREMAARVRVDHALGEARNMLDVARLDQTALHAALQSKTQEAEEHLKAIGRSNEEKERLKEQARKMQLTIDSVKAVTRDDNVPMKAPAPRHEPPELDDSNALPAPPKKLRWTGNKSQTQKRSQPEPLQPIDPALYHFLGDSSEEDSLNASGHHKSSPAEQVDELAQMRASFAGRGRSIFKTRAPLRPLLNKKK